MRFLADMGVGVRVVEWLRAQGHDAVHLREEDLQRFPDERVFAKALAEDRIILTFDLGFGDLARLSRDRPGRVIVFRLENAQRVGAPGLLARRVLTRVGTYDTFPPLAGRRLRPGRRESSS